MNNIEYKMRPLRPLHELQELQELLDSKLNPNHNAAKVLKEHFDVKGNSCPELYAGISTFLDCATKLNFDASKMISLMILTFPQSTLS